MSGGLLRESEWIRSDLNEWARTGLLRASAAGAVDGIPGTEARGQLIRPLVALAGVGTESPPSESFWSAVLAVQLAHEASLLHDDIVDGAAERRGQPTLAASEGVARALLRGDHLLTASYRAAARTGSLRFVSLFSRAVERTVAGEAAQGAVLGRVLDRSRYDEIVLGKSGELVGIALAAAALLEHRVDAGELFEVGRRFGLLYQMLDDLLDYCPHCGTGKPPLSDYAQGRWTWLLEEVPGLEFGGEPEEALDAVHRHAPGGSAMRRALARFEAEAATLRATVRTLVPRGWILESMIVEWTERARGAVAVESARRKPPLVRPGGSEARVDALLRGRVPSLDSLERYLAVNSRSFRFAARLFPRSRRDQVARVYAFCRITDDLVDRPAEGVPAADLLDSWLARCRLAYDGESTGLGLLDVTIRDMAAAGVPLRYAEDLVEGMRMDVRGERYETLGALRVYTYRVAGVVGLWLTRLFGVHDPAMLARAERLGHAMQLTNILRDVGEDWRQGRVYLPGDFMTRHGIREIDLEMMAAGRPITTEYRALVEELIGVADADYREALLAVPELPGWYGRPVAVAAHVYRGIHQEIRRLGHDNLRSRAYTSLGTKAWLGAAALWELYRVPRSVPLPIRSGVAVPLARE